MWDTRDRREGDKGQGSEKRRESTRSRDTYKRFGRTDFHTIVKDRRSPESVVLETSHVSSRYKCH